MLVNVILVSLSSAFVILLMGKTGVRDGVIAKAPALVSKLFSCDFCLSFWTSVVIVAAAIAVTGDISLAAVPIFSTPITRILT